LRTYENAGFLQSIPQFGAPLSPKDLFAGAGTPALRPAFLIARLWTPLGGETVAKAGKKS
jgi:hypothetical protein